MDLSFVKRGVEMNFDFATANRIIFGPGTARKVGQLASEMGSQAMVVTGKDSQRHAFLIQDLESHGIGFEQFSVPKEPTDKLIMAGIEAAQRARCDLVIAIGGGSVIDSGKAIAAMLNNQGDLNDYLEVIGKGKSIENKLLPNIVLPTTAGTGSEVTRNAVLMSTEHKVKVSMRSPMMLPQIAIVDPELTYPMPPQVTAGTGLDALTQLLEAFVSTNANPMTDAVCREGLKRAARSLEHAYQDGNDKRARYDMCVASLFGGMALANAKLGAVHGIAGPLGGMYPGPHGMVCGRLLSSVMQVNVKTLQQQLPNAIQLARYEEIARIVTADQNALAEDGIAWIQSLCDRLEVPPLSQYGLDDKGFPTLVQSALRASSMKGNPVKLTEEDVLAILQQTL
jgi:alcohol dehydrogenase class IV